MSSFKVEFTIKQHTPIIHFQSDQAGATLRATELKPKLDRFLIESVYKNEKIKYENFLINKESDAFNYKVKIKDYKGSEIDIKNKTYFANMGKKSYDVDFRKATMARDDFKIEFISFDTKILNTIKEYFASFLVKTNFGTRQNKGFGSFYLSEMDLNYIEPNIALTNTKTDYIYATYDGQKTESVFSHVEVIYPLIKTGINFPDHPKKTITTRDGKTKEVPDLEGGRGPKASYYKSYLFQYMLQKNPPIGNEKKFIKENFFDNVKDDYSNEDNQIKKYVRALLGTSDGVEFKDKRSGKIQFSNPTIKRFKSPLTFKIIKDSLFIIAEPINKSLFGKQFTFSQTFKSRGEDKTVNKTIEIPTQNEFDLVDFLYSFADYFNNLNPTNKNMFDQKIIASKKASFIKALK